MGLIKALSGSITTELADQWKEYIYCDTLDNNTLVQKGYVRVTGGSNTKRSENIITNGSRIAVNEGQCMLVVENGKIVDYTAEAGAYIYDTGTEPSLFDGGFKGLKESFAKVGKRFTFGGQPENDQRVYFVNTKEIIDNKVGVGDVPFRDSEFGFTIKLHGYGVYSYRISDPVMFYTNLCANVTDSFKKQTIDEQLKTEVQSCLQPALGRIALKGIPYDNIVLYTKEIAEELNTELSDDWHVTRGISMVSVAFSSLAPDEDSAEKIAQFQESRVYTNAGMMGARLGQAQATAMENAASNPNGAMMGFMGMGMAQAAGGANAASFFNMNNQQQAQQQAAVDTWKCTCGAENTGKFCSECGAKKPEANSWVCSCGAENTGKFCSECGAKKPETATCASCGYALPEGAPTPKFCPECGRPFNG